MSTLDKISILLKEQGTKQKDLTDYLGVSKNQFTDWKSGRIKSYTKYIPQIAEFLGVSTDYLLGTEQKEKPTATSDELSKLLSISSGLSEDNKQKLLDYARLLQNSQKQDK